MGKTKLFSVLIILSLVFWCDAKPRRLPDDIIKDNKPNLFLRVPQNDLSGRCAWCVAESFIRYFGDNKLADLCKGETNSDFVYLVGFCCKSDKFSIMSIQVDTALNKGFLFKFEEQPPYLVIMKTPDPTTTHAIALIDYDENWIWFIDPNTPKYIQKLHREYFEEKWTGLAITFHK